MDRNPQRSFSIDVTYEHDSANKKKDKEPTEEESDKKNDKKNESTRGDDKEKKKNEKGGESMRGDEKEKKEKKNESIRGEEKKDTDKDKEKEKEAKEKAKEKEASKVVGVTEDNKKGNKRKGKFKIKKKEQSTFREERSKNLEVGTNREKKESIRVPKSKNQAPKDEPDVDQLQLEPELLASAKLFEGYKTAMMQICIALTQMMRRGNETTDMEAIKSERGKTAPERLFKATFNAHGFWQLATEFQPALHDSLKNNSVQLGAVERNLQERGPKHLKKIRKFVYRHYLQYVDIKKEIHKLNKSNPESVHTRRELFKKMAVLIKEKYTNQKQSHFEEIQCAFIELMMFHRNAEKYWYNISERKPSKAPFVPEPFDFSQIFK